MRIVLDNIRGKSTTEALNILRFTPRRAAKILEKVVTSAVANAENNMQMDSEKLYIHRAYVDGGPVMKRFRAASMGRATPVRRRTSHITIVVKEKGE
ncbi:MAG: 50S ribosomal protein L22 [Firmicutes bacterium]|nr:50S ribosomal protein L22 [Bacillota bacterium]